MPEYINENAPTRSAVLELKEERQVIREGYEFLDEKRLLLAAEILRQLHHYQTLMDDFHKRHLLAITALSEATNCLGLQGIEVYPAQNREDVRVTSEQRSFLGVVLQTTRLDEGHSPPAPPAVVPSPETWRCQRSYHALTDLSAVIAGVSGNLQRLLAEYRRTERRARALEDVILPEIEDGLRTMESRLEEIDQEESIRVRLNYRR